MSGQDAIPTSHNGAAARRQGQLTAQEHANDTQQQQQLQSLISLSTFSPSLQWQGHLEHVLQLCRNSATTAADPSGSDLIYPPSGFESNPRHQQFLAALACTAAETKIVERTDSASNLETISAVSTETGSGIHPENDVGTTAEPSPEIAMISPPPPCRSDHLDNSARASASTDVDIVGKVLILFDMNGTLLYRAKRPLQLPAGQNNPPEPAFTHGDPDPFQYFMRPGARELIKSIARHPRTRMAFYTSMRGVNALPAALFLMPGDCSSEKEPEIYDRPFNAHDLDGTNHWDTKRDLPKIWSTGGRAGAGFDVHNTVMVDDTPRKMRDMSAGLVVVPEYKEACVLAACGMAAEVEDERAARQAEREQADILPRLTEYLLRLLDSDGGDVRPFIESNPFRPHASALDTQLDTVEAELPALKARTIPDSADSAPVPTSCVPGGEEGPWRSKDAVFSLLDAVYLLLSTGPLANRFDWATSFRPPSLTEDVRTSQCCSPELSGDDMAKKRVFVHSPSGSEVGIGMARAAAAAANERKEKHEVTVAIAGVGANNTAGGSNGKNIFLRSAVSAVKDLLEEVCAAAERWQLRRIEKEILKSWFEAVNAMDGQYAPAPEVEVLCPIKRAE